jgi:hypothetical protein
MELVLPLSTTIWPTPMKTIPKSWDGILLCGLDESLYKEVWYMEMLRRAEQTEGEAGYMEGRVLSQRNGRSTVYVILFLSSAYTHDFRPCNFAEWSSKGRDGVESSESSIDVSHFSVESARLNVNIKIRERM